MSHKATTRRKQLSSSLNPVVKFAFSTNYKDALKYGFYELQSARDWYREVTSDVGMHSTLVNYWMRTAALLVMPIAPHFAEHIWSGILKQPSSIQLALWPTPTQPIDAALLEAAAYMRGTTKTIRDAEAALVKMLSKSQGKGKGTGKKDERAMFDPRKPKTVSVYVATAFPEWQDTCVQAVKEAYVKEEDRVDDVKVREVLTEKGLIKDKRAMPFVQAFKVRMNAFRGQLT
jgi:leucyl-tRNA synthetase